MFWIPKMYGIICLKRRWFFARSIAVAVFIARSMNFVSWSRDGCASMCIYRCVCCTHTVDRYRSSASTRTESKKATTTTESSTMTTTTMQRELFIGVSLLNTQLQHQIITRLSDVRFFALLVRVSTISFLLLHRYPSPNVSWFQSIGSPLWTSLA